MTTCIQNQLLTRSNPLHSYVCLNICCMMLKLEHRLRYVLAHNAHILCTLMFISYCYDVNQPNARTSLQLQ